MPSRIVYLNNAFLPLDQAHISVMDRGFLFGDGVYEVIPMFQGKLLRPHEHLQRFKKSLEAIRLDYAFEEKFFTDIFETLFQRNPDQGLDRAFYLQITRGAYENREHIFPKQLSPTIFAQCTPLTPLSVETLSHGAKAITVPDIRWAHCFVKAITLLPNVLLAQQALENDAKEAIMIRDGLAIEGVSSNLVIIKDGTLITPPADGHILSGVTRMLIFEIAKQLQIPVIEKDIPLELLKTADEVWMTGSLKEILPITQIDETVVGNGQVGPLWHQFFQLYQRAKVQPSNEL